MIVEYHKKSDGVLRCEYKTTGEFIVFESRFLSFWERIVLWFGGKP